MPPIILNEVARCSIVWGLPNGQEAVNVVHVRYDPAVLDVDAQGAAEQVRDAAQDHLMGWMAVGTTFKRVEFVDLDSANGETGIVPPDGTKPTAGLSANPAPLQVAAVVELGPGNRGNRRGRWYLPGLSEAHIDNGYEIAPDDLTALQATIQAFADGINSTNYQIGWVSHKPPAAATFQVANTYSLRARLGTQRRRILL